MGLLDKLSRAASLADLARHGDITVDDVLDPPRAGLPRCGNLDKIKQLRRVVYVALEQLAKHLGARTAAPPQLHQLLPPGAASAVASLLCLWAQFLGNALHERPVCSCIWQEDSPQRFASACSAVSRAVAASSSQAAAAAAATRTSRLEQSGVPDLVMQLLLSFNALARLEMARHRQRRSSSSRGGAAAQLSPELVGAASTAVAELALAVLRSQPLLSCSAASNNKLWRRVMQTPAAKPHLGLQAVKTIEILSNVCGMADEDAIPCVFSEDLPAPHTDPAATAALLQLSGSISVQQATLAYLALAAKCSASNSHQPAQQQEQQEQAASQQLLRALDIAESVLSGEASVVTDFSERLASDLDARGNPTHLPAGAGTVACIVRGLSLASQGGPAHSSSGAGSRPSSVQPAPGLLALACVAADVTIECARLTVPDSAGMTMCLRHTLELISFVAEQEGCRHLPAARQEQLVALLPSLVALLPVVQAQGSGSMEEQRQQLSLLGRAVTMATGMLDDDAGCSSTGLLADLLLRHVIEYGSLLEAGVREATVEGWWLSTAALIVDISHRAVMGPPGICMPVMPVALTLDPAASQQVFALLLSCMKKTELMPQLRSLAFSANRIHSCLTQSLKCLVYVSASVEQVPSQHRCSRLWHLMAGRCLIYLGRAVKQTLQEPPAAGGGSDVPPGFDLLTQNMLKMVETCTTVMAKFSLSDEEAWAAVSGPAAAADPAARLRLLEHAQQLQQQLDTASSTWQEARRPPGAGWQAFAAAVGEPLAQQLEAFGAALCAQLPGRFCCNNHGCTNLAERSELRLVGAASVCSGCKTARYCSAACQKAHWKEWHKPVCKAIKQQQEAAATATA